MLKLDHLLVNVLNGRNLTNILLEDRKNITLSVEVLKRRRVVNAGHMNSFLIGTWGRA